jgi:hypothetical protein
MIVGHWCHPQNNSFIDNQSFTIMKEMLMLLAASMSKEDVIERLNDAMVQYNEAKLLNNEDSIEQAEKDIFVATNLFIMNYVTKGDIKNAISNIKQMDEIERAHKFFQTPNN